MSATATEEEIEAEGRATENLCASCGIAELDNIGLEECDGDKNCSDECRKDHRQQNDRECKSEDDLHDKILFTQPDSSHYGECPICFLPLPLKGNRVRLFYACCSKVICQGCDYANGNMSNKRKREKLCPFCREPTPKDNEEIDRRRIKRVKANDPVAMKEMGAICCNDGDYERAFEYLTKAAELGDSSSHHNLSVLYYNGWGVEKDAEKEVYHLERAAIGGHPGARHNLGCVEHEAGRVERAVKHFIIAAKLGYELSMKTLRDYYSDNITKEDLKATVRAHQAAVEAMKSPQREAASAERERV